MGAADVILLNANVIPVTLPNKREHALAISQGKIAAVGSNWAVLQLRDPHTEVIDLAGRTVLPGFVDSHVHLFLTAAAYHSVRLDQAQSVDEACRLVGEEAARASADEWVYGFNWPTWAIGRLPRMDELDSVSGDHPVYVSSDSFHSGAANSKAFGLIAAPGSMHGVEMDAETSKPTGSFLTDTAHFWAASRALSALSDASIEEYLRSAADQAVKKGVTTLHCLDGQFLEGDRDVEVLLGLDANLPLHTLLMYQTMDVQRVVELGLPRIGGCLTIDGAGGEHTALFYEPYSDMPGVYGDLYIPEEKVKSFVLEAHSAGLQIGMHAIGDRAIDILVDAYGEASQAEPRADCRHRVEHFYVPTDRAINKARELGLALTMQPAFSWTCDLPENSFYEAIWGRERADRAEPFPRLCQMGIVVAGGSDSPVTDIDPLLGIHSAVNNPNPIRRVSVDDALRMFTINGAWTGHEEHSRGSLTVGKVADIVVLNEDPYLKPDAIKDLEVCLTMSEGDITHALL